MSVCLGAAGTCRRRCTECKPRPCTGTGQAADRQCGSVMPPLPRVSMDWEIHVRHGSGGASNDPEGHPSMGRTCSEGLGVANCRRCCVTLWMGLALAWGAWGEVAGGPGKSPVSFFSHLVIVRWTAIPGARNSPQTYGKCSKHRRSDMEVNTTWMCGQGECGYFCFLGISVGFQL